MVYRSGESASGVQPAAPAAAETRKRKAWDERIERVLGRVTWSTHTPASEQELYAELALMRSMAEKKTWHRVDDAWRASLLPRGGLVRRKADGWTFFVIRNYSVACVAWQAEEAALGLWRHATSASSLTWVTVLDLSDFEEIPVEYASPLHLFLEAQRNNPLLCARAGNDHKGRM
ncbi:MAG: hypothetical protein GY772_20375 [bacterium]|nr:hypothetical protein [bacterium]